MGAERRLRPPLLVLLLGSSALLGGALLFQHVGGYPPCQMCHWQRWPHAAALVLGSLALFVRPLRRPLIIVAALAVLVSAGLGAFHVGVEQGWWEGPTTCSATAVDMADIFAAPIVRCDEVAWSLFGVSMAGYNFILSLIIGGTALWLTIRRR